MNDLTLLYYTANRIHSAFAMRVRNALLASAPAVELLCVSQQQMDFTYVADEEDAFWSRPQCGYIWVGEIGASIYNVYRQILIGAKAATTPFVACCEDDSLYVPEHFTYRPALDTFAYNLNRWVITRELAPDGRSRVGTFYWRRRTQMAQCIAPRELLIETLEERFAKYPDPVPHEIAKKTGWGEPGRYEKNLGLAPRKIGFFETREPNVTFNHGESLMGRRRVNPDDIIREELPPWGNATELWNRIHG